MDLTFRIIEMINDERLMKNYLVGAISAFEELYRRHRQRVYHMALHHLQDPIRAESATQRVFFKLHQKRHRYDSRFSLLQWLFVIARLEILETKEWTEDVELMRNPSDQGFQEQMDQQLAQLSEQKAELLHMKFVDGLAFEEIAALLRELRK